MSFLLRLGEAKTRQPQHKRQRCIRSLHVKSVNINDRIAQMSKDEKANIIANLRLNRIAPYALHTSPTEFVVNEVGVACDEMVKVNLPDMGRAVYQLSQPSDLNRARGIMTPMIHEIAGTILMHPVMGEKILVAMMDGRKVVMNVERIEAKPPAPVVVKTAVVDDQPSPAAVAEEEVISTESEQDDKKSKKSKKKRKGNKSYQHQPASSVSVH